ncbi:MAG: radical SAM protein [Candidatus ainarchaeum sp.]|nr:radical SAM protein [Candidatus ainarchaeum sp.]
MSFIIKEKKSVVTNSYGSNLPYITKSICPECKRILDAKVYAKKDVVYLLRTCPNHGEFDELYWESVDDFNKAKKYASNARGLLNSNVSITNNTGSNCPFDCGLCTNHHSHTALANIAITNRCDLSCWYCFFYAKAGDPIYEPSLEQIRLMLKNLKSESPVPCNAIQLTGGEPTLRDDLFEIIRIVKEEGFDHIQLNTTGMTIAFNSGYAMKLKEAGVSTLYVSFDGTTPQTNPKNHYEMPKTIAECRKANLGIVLVPTLIKGVNDNDIGNIIDFALQNIDVVRGVDFQPVSFVGRMPKSQREKQRITIPKTTQLIQEQTNNLIRKKDFFTIPCISPVTNFIEALTNKAQYSLDNHFACGMATYVFLNEKNEVLPLPEFVDVDGLFKFLREMSNSIEEGKNKRIETAKLLLKLKSFINQEKKPKDLNLTKLLFDALVKHDYSALGEFHTKSLFIGMMHFMDSYNYDQQRVERCDIHYATPDGRIIPFCAFNVVPELYRDKVQKQYSISWEEFRQTYVGESKDPLQKYVRNIKELENSLEYKKAYSKKKYFFEK